MRAYWEIQMPGEDTPWVVKVQPQILNADGNPMRLPEAVDPQDTSWQKDINPESLFALSGHWFEIVGMSPDGVMCKWRGATGKKRKGKA